MIYFTISHYYENQKNNDRIICLMTVGCANMVKEIHMPIHQLSYDAIKLRSLNKLSQKLNN